MPFKVECGTETYRLVAPDGEPGHNVPWGAIASVKYGNDLYYCEGVEDADDQLVEKVLSTRAQDGTGGQQSSECVDVAFDGEAEDEDDDDPDGGEELEEEIEDEEDDEESRVA